MIIYSIYICVCVKNIRRFQFGFWLDKKVIQVPHGDRSIPTSARLLNESSVSGMQPLMQMFVALYRVASMASTNGSSIGLMFDTLHILGPAKPESDSRRWRSQNAFPNAYVHGNLTKWHTKWPTVRAFSAPFWWSLNTVSCKMRHDPHFQHGSHSTTTPPLQLKRMHSQRSW